MPGNKKPNRKGKKKQPPRAHSVPRNLNHFKSKAEVAQTVQQMQHFADTLDEREEFIFSTMRALTKVVSCLKTEHLVSQEAPALEQRFHQCLELMESQKPQVFALEDKIAQWERELRKDNILLLAFECLPESREMFVLLTQHSEERIALFERVLSAMRLLAQYLAELHAKAQQIVAQQGPFGSAAEQDAALQAATKEVAFQLVKSGKVDLILEDLTEFAIVNILHRYADQL